MISQLSRYQSADEDSFRWRGFAFRPGDIVNSTRSKSGTTWMQMICALLVLQTTDLPAPLAQLSPWMDWLVEPRDRVHERLAEQRHRRFIKTHTPLDGVPSDPRVTYIVVARHPLDMAVSLYHQSDNLDRNRLRTLTGQAPPGSPPSARLPVQEWLRSWIHRASDPRQELDSLPGVMWHLSDAWARRDQPNILLVHYADLAADLDGQMRQVASRLGISVAAADWPALVRAATFAQMRERAEHLAPDPSGVLRNKQAFFREGGSGSGRQLLSADEYAGYLACASRLAPADLMDWVHRDQDGR